MEKVKAKKTLKPDFESEVRAALALQTRTVLDVEELVTRLTKAVSNLAPVQAVQKNQLMVALCKAQMEIGALGRESQANGYKYVSSEKMIDVCRKALHKHDLTPLRRHYKTDMERNMVTSYYEVWYKDGADSLDMTGEFPIVASTRNPADKAVAIALTTGMSYWLRDLLLIPRQDDDKSSVAEMDSRREDEAAEASKSSKKEDLVKIEKTIAWAKEHKIKTGDLLGAVGLKSVSQVKAEHLPKMIDYVKSKGG